MRRTTSTWLAWFSGALALTTGIIGMAGHAPAWTKASTDELSTSWSRVSPELLNEYGGVTIYGNKTEASNSQICQTNRCRSVGGHGYVCLDYGYNLLTISSGFNYAKSQTLKCGNEIRYTFDYCYGDPTNVGNCAAGSFTYTDHYDP